MTYRQMLVNGGTTNGDVLLQNISKMLETAFNEMQIDGSRAVSSQGDGGGTPTVFPAKDR
ncbi:MAG: hypothetical protein ACT4OY_06395 [Alphaproteobacteria bacterium]